MKFAFDLDGVLVSTRSACLEAYRSVGVEPPDNFHVIGWETWCDRHDHDARNEVLHMFTHLIHPLPLLEMALQRRAPVFSSCSRAAYNWVREAIPNLRLLQITCELRQEAKLNAIRAVSETGVYFDDSEEFCRVVAQETRWQACRVL